MFGGLACDVRWYVFASVPLRLPDSVGGNCARLRPGFMCGRTRLEVYGAGEFSFVQRCEPVLASI